MHSNDAQDMLSDFEPRPLAIGPDGGIELTEQVKIIPPPPRLCEAGPCRHYHRFVIQLDAEAPRGQGVEPGGKIIGLPEGQPFHTSTKHYCYPALGIETELGALPVLECNFWDPLIKEVREIDERRESFLASALGQKFREAQAAWRAQISAEIDEGDEVASWIQIHMRDGDELEIVASVGPVFAGRTEGGPVTPLSVWTRDGADQLSKAFLREHYGEGAYRLWIWRSSGEARERVATKRIEVI
jgi:hypothetical protein